MSVRILVGNSLDVLKTLPGKSVQMCVTSPPYYGLRSYLPDGHEDKHLELGLEKTPQLYVDAMVQVFSEVKRVLRDDGTLWLNIGDSYAGSWGAQSRANGSDIKSTLEGGSMLLARQIEAHPRMTQTGSLKNTPGCKPKDLIGIPWMLAFALRADGWYLRSDIIWHKPNPMPESVTDRPTKCHEYVFLLSKSPAYYYDAGAIAEPVAASQLGRVRADPVGGTSHAERGQHSAGGVYRTNGKHSTQDKQSAGRRIVENVARARAEGADHDNPFGTTRNARSVWSITTLPYAEAHFATFPPKLIEPCILAGSARQACEKCGAPWVRVFEPTGHVNKREPAHVPGNCATKVDSTGWAPVNRATDRLRPTCKCENEGTATSTVLDPFGGAGTTGLVADRLDRDALLIELNPAYAKMARERIHSDNPLFGDVA